MRAEHIERRVGEQMVLMESISAAYGQLVRPGIENISRQRLETRLDAVNEDWERFRLNHTAINIAVDKLDTTERRFIRTLPYFDDHMYAATQDNFLETVEKFKILMAQQLELTSRASASSDAAQINTTNQLHSNQHDMRLPRINLPHYDGTHQDWLSFKDLFSSMVVANQSISSIEKMHYLKSCLRGPAAQLLDTTTVTADNFYQAWETLKSFYDSRRILVGATLDSFFAIKSIKQESGLELERLYTSMTQVYRSLQTLRRPVEYWDDILVYIIVRQKLDSRSLRAWEQHIGSSDEPPTWDKLQSFIIARSRTLRAIENSHGRKTVASPRIQRPGLKSHFTSHQAHKDEKKMTDSCQLCSEKHRIIRCPEYHRKTVQQRNQIVKDCKLCFNCLGPHQMFKCQSTARCQTCGKKHHTSLHEKRPSSSSNATSSAPSPKQVNHLHSSPATIILPTAIVKIFNSIGESLHIRALLDQGSEISLISEKITQRLRLTRKQSSLPIIGIGAYPSGNTKGIASVRIQPRFKSNFEFVFDAHILPKLTSTIPAEKTSPSTWKHIKNLRLADPHYTEPGSIEMIIGADVYGTLLEEQIVHGPPFTPTAQSTKLGWIVSGPTSKSPMLQNVTSNHCSIDTDLHNLLERFWHQEEIKESKQTLSPDDKACEEIFKTTHSRDPQTGKYIVRLPFKSDLRLLGDSKPSALRLLHSLQTKFANDSEYHKLYSSFLEEYEQLGHMVRLTNSTPVQHPSFLLPHHGVKRESSTTTKLRVVFNGSCKTINGEPINKLLHSGPKLQLDLFNILIWIRQHKYMFTADIEKMYRQIQVHPDDWKLQQILWKENETITTFQLTTVTYGLACAPYLALRSVLQLVEDEGKTFPLAIDTMLKGRYVDDIFGGGDSIKEAEVKARQVYELCMAGGFPLRKWISNNPEVLQQIPDQHKVSTEEIPIKDQSVHALGLLWNPSEDYLHFKFSSQQPKFTKRSVLSKIAQLFDPLGLLSPTFITAKIFMQELWAIKLHWDDELPGNQHQTWTKILQSLNGLELIKIPRWFGTVTTSTIELHGFSDASQLAMSAAVYILTRNNDQVTTTLLCSKTKVAPLKRLTIPRLELSAAVLLTRLMSQCIDTLHLQHAPCYMWTDSTITFTWIKNHPSKWKEYIHNRVCLIQETLPHAQWRHVPGEQNPADCASRGVSSEELKNHPLWWTGPSWLHDDPGTWPKPPTGQPNIKELELRNSSTAQVLHTSVSLKQWELLYRYSSFQKLIRVTAMCWRVINRLRRTSTTPPSSPLTPEELDKATKHWVRITQQYKFMTELSLLRHHSKELQKSHPFIKLFPFIDQQGLLRVGGRLKNSLLPHNAKHPYILPKESQLTRIIIRDAHEKTMHGSTQETLSFIRQNFWIIGGRKPIRSFINKCPRCIRYRAQASTHIMGQLPSTRVTPGRAFLHSGVDYAGPFMIKTWKGRSTKTYKAWVSLFICLSTSAIHLELVTDYSTDAFIAAYKRFTARRGICATLTSDRGTNFMGADSELRKMFNQHSEECKQITSIITNQGTKWIFNPPASPHFGGKWEAGVKSMKYHLRRVVGESLLTYEEFTTVLCQIEGILNSRPLCPLTDDPNDLDVLTPGHFLIGHSINLIPEPNLQHIKVSRLSRWQHLSHMTQSFWEKWSREYLQRFLTSYKWNKAVETLQEGSLVLISDERCPPAKWPLGRIIKLHQGSDGIARVATVKTSTSSFTRPIVKLCPLHITADTSSSPESTKAGGNVKN